MLEPAMGDLRAGDEQAWGAAFQWLWPKAFAAAARRLGAGNSTDVEDIAVRAIREVADMVAAGRDFGGIEELTMLTVVVADRRATDHLRRITATRRAKSATDSIDGLPEAESKAPGPIEMVEAKLVSEALARLMGVLSRSARQLVCAYYLDGLKQEEVAARFNMPLGTVGVTLSRALKALRTELQNHPHLMKELLEALR